MNKTCLESSLLKEESLQELNLNKNEEDTVYKPRWHTISIHASYSSTDEIFVGGIISFSVFNNAWPEISRRFGWRSTNPWRGGARTKKKKKRTSCASLVTSAAPRKYQTSLILWSSSGCIYHTRIKESMVHHTGIGLSRCSRAPWHFYWRPETSYFYIQGSYWQNNSICSSKIRE